MNATTDFSHYTLNELKQLQFSANHHAGLAERLTRHLLANGKQPAKWYYAINGKESNSLNLLELRELLSTNQLSLQDYVWQERMSGWVKANTIPALIDPVSGTPVTPVPAKQKNNAPLMIAGILQGLMVFVWIVVAVVQLFESNIGGAPKIGGFLLCGTLGLMSIPVTLGLIAGKKWGFVLKLIQGVTALGWIFGRLINGINNEEWILLIVLESVILTLVLLNARNYK